MNADRKVPKIDRRIQRTKQLLSRALIELILEKGYEDVTVQDILDSANIGRATFYTHYENKELLLLDGPRNLGLSLFGEEEKSPANAQGINQRMAFRNLFEHVSKNPRLAKAMLGKKSGNIFIDSFRNQISGAIKEHFKSKFSNEKKAKLLLSYLSQAAAAAIISLMTSWIDDDFSMSVDDVSMRSKCMVDAIMIM